MGNNETHHTGARDQETSFTFGGVGWIFSNLTGLTAALIVVGYLAHVSQESFIGFPIDINVPADLILLAVRCLGKLCYSLIDPVVLAELAVILFLLHRVNLRLSERNHSGLPYKLALTLTLFVTKLLLFDLPPLALRGVMLQVPHATSDFGSGFLSWRTAEIWKGLYCLYGKDGSACLICWNLPIDLDHYIGHDLILLAALSYMIGTLLSRKQLTGLTKPERSFLAVLSTLLLIAGCAFLPVLYGKLVMKDDYPQITVTLNATEPPEPVQGKGVEAPGRKSAGVRKGSPAPRQPELKGKGVQASAQENAGVQKGNPVPPKPEVHGLLSSHNDAGLTVWGHTDHDPPGWIFIPYSSIRVIRYNPSQTREMLLKRFLQDSGTCQ